MLSKKSTGLAVVMAATVMLFVTVGVPGPVWLAGVLALAVVVELAAFVVSVRDSRA